jgi:hypothetical protein
MVRWLHDRGKQPDMVTMPAVPALHFTLGVRAGYLQIVRYVVLNLRVDTVKGHEPFQPSEFEIMVSSLWFAKSSSNSAG